MPSLILNATDISKLLETYPEVKIELLRNATDQIAESLKRKVGELPVAITDKLMKDITTEVNVKLRDGYTFPPVIHKAIERVAQSYLDRLVRIDIDAIVKKATDEALQRAEEKMKAAAEAVIRKSFTDMVDAASRLRR